MCIYDYLVSEVVIAEDLLDKQSFIDAANVCDKEVVFPWSKEAGTKSKTYEISSVVDTAQNPMQVINNMLYAMDGNIIFDNGKWKLFAGSSITCNHSINDDDLFGNPVISYTKNHQEKVNSVKISFIDSSIIYKPATINISSDRLIIEDGKKLTKNLDISFVSSRDHITYLAHIALKKSRKKIAINFAAKLHTILIPINAGVKITLKKYGWNNKQFRLLRSVFNVDSHIDLTFEELDNSVLNIENIS